MRYRAGGVVETIHATVRTRCNRRSGHASPTYVMREVINPQTGILGTTVSLKTRYGQVRRQYVKPKNPRTPAQMRIRSNLGRVAARWRTLTEEQRAAWTLGARETQSRHRLGRSSHLTGCQFFIKINCARGAVGLSQLVDPPKLPEFDANPVGALVLTNTGGAIAVKLKVAGTPEADIVVLGVGPRSAGVSYAWNFVALGLLPAPVRGLSDITELYVARFGVPGPGMRVFIRTRQQINGWEDAPKQISAIVPKP
jgi:hypothetical protein